MMATRLFGFYRASDANDPEVFVAGATATLALYPEAIVMKVCDPIRGLPSTSTFLPALAEIRQACEREMIWHDAVVKRDRERAHTAEILKPASSPTEESRRRVRDAADGFLAELNAKGEPHKIDFKPPRSPAEAEAARRHFEARLVELEAAYRDKPLSVSRAALEAFARGAPAPEHDETDP
jgi:hypothetical protein